MPIDDRSLQSIKNKYEKFKTTYHYQYSSERKKFVSLIAKPILDKFVGKKSIDQDDLIALIEIFKVDCTPQKFEEKLGILKFDEYFSKKILQIFKQISIKGYTGAGYHALVLDKEKVEIVFNFLRDVYGSDTEDRIRQFVDDFDSEKIPRVKYGTYSPWLHYMHPTLCPIVNNPVVKFLRDNGIKISGYTEAWKNLKEINQFIGESLDYGEIDYFIRWLGEGEPDINKGFIALRGEKIDFENYLLLKKKQIILYGPPGTGKTFKTKEYAGTFIKVNYSDRNP